MPPLGSGLTMPLLMIQDAEDRVTSAATNAERLTKMVPGLTLQLYDIRPGARVMIANAARQHAECHDTDIAALRALGTCFNRR